MHLSHVTSVYSTQLDTYCCYKTAHHRIINETTRRDLLQLVDHTRDETLPSLGVHVHDEQDNDCTWMLLPPESRRGRQQRLEDQEREQQVGVADLEDTGAAGAGAEESAEPGDATWADGEEEAQQQQQQQQPRVGDAGRRRE